MEEAPRPVMLATLRLLAMVPEEQVAELLSRVADRYERALRASDSGEGSIVFRWHRGRHREFRINLDDRL